MALLLMASLIVMLYYSRKAVKDETLQMASQTLEGAVLRIDNLLLSVEQTAGNYYFSLLPHLNRPDMVLDYSRKLVETNPYVSGCSIAFKPNYYQNHEYFMAHSYRGEGDEASVIQSESSDNRSYTAQEWYTKSMASVKPGWLRSDVDADKDLITFCLPIPGADGQPIGVMGVDVLLSQPRYAKTRNFMDFDPGVDEDKVGDSEYPNAGVDSVMKHEFMEDISNDTR